MKLLILVGLSLVSVSAFARDVQLNVDFSKHTSNFSSATLEVTYESQSKAFGCQTYSGDILDPARPIYIEETIEHSNGKVSRVIPSELERCKAKLVSVDLYVRLDRKAVARANNASKSDVDKNRIDFHFNVLEASQVGSVGPRDIAHAMHILKLYVAGSDELKYTLSCSNQAVLIINDKIELLFN